MARSKRTQSAAAPGCNNTDIVSPQDRIDGYWELLPPRAKQFILDTPDGKFPLSKLICFWSSPNNVGYTRDNILFNAAWYLALVYLKYCMIKEAQALIINGSFINQCYNSSIGYIKTLCDSGVVIPEQKLPYFFDCFNSLRSTSSMESYARSCLPHGYSFPRKNVTSFADIDHLWDGWKGTSSASRNGHHPPSSTDNGTQIKINLVDDMNEEERHSFNIGSSTTLKSLFNDYADKRGISLRSLRFSCAGVTLFLSSAAHKTPEELGMMDEDVIMVHDTSSKPQESSDGNSSSQHTSTSKKTKAKKRSNKKAKGKSKNSQQHEEPAKTLEEHKVQHSMQLTKIHGEAQAQFKQIRQCLNNLVIERSLPKIKSKRPHNTSKNKPFLPYIVNNSFKEGLGGKAGKSHYAIQVGEVQNLYKTTKTSTMAFHYSSSNTLDLHGCTREEALIKLDESLKVWVDTAMQGSYPFVQPAVIVCGCGNQILSQAVQEWIRSNDNVSNAPKVRSSRR